VKAVELSPHTDYQLKATIQMLSLQQAIGAVSGLHRYKIGGKRIQVSLITGGGNKSLSMLRYSYVWLSFFYMFWFRLRGVNISFFLFFKLYSTEIISILQDAPANCLPLFKFTEIYEKK